MTKQVIPDAAVEAAAEAYASGETGGEIWDHPDHEAEARLRAQAILEAAAPHMLAAFMARATPTKCCGNYSPTPCHGCD